MITRKVFAKSMTVGSNDYLEIGEDFALVRRDGREIDRTALVSVEVDPETDEPYYPYRFIPAQKSHLPKHTDTRS